MCDTIAATGRATAHGFTLFGKNSDRHPNEAQNICLVPGRSHGPGEKVTCTYISIPQAEKTHGVLLSRPFWMWGAEMGVNEHGLAIGNEAVFTKVAAQKGAALTGMDLVRLALERAATARKGVDIITRLLARHGQGGNCGYPNPLYYHNSFLLADPGSVWVLETAGEHWAAREVQGVYAISNKLTIESAWDLASENLVSFAVEKGWCRSARDFSFSKSYSDFLYTKFSSSQYRRDRAMALMDRNPGKLTVNDFFSILRDHGDPSGKFCPDRGLVRSRICNHAGWGPVRISQTTGSLVSMLSPGASLHFATGTSAPCTALFKPLWADIRLSNNRYRAGGTYDPSTLFWAHESLHRATLANYRESMALIVPERDRIEARLTDQALAALNQKKEQRQAIADLSFETGFKFEKDCLAKVENITPAGSPGFFYTRSWNKRNKAIGLNRFRPAHG